MAANYALHSTLRPPVSPFCDARPLIALHTRTPSPPSPCASQVFIKATGKTFCGGGDLKDFKAMAEMPAEHNKMKAIEFASFLKEINTFPKPVVGLVNGPALGGGVGLISVCDFAIGVESTAAFALSEVRGRERGEGGRACVVCCVLCVVCCVWV